MSASVIGGKMLKIKLNLFFVWFVNLNSEFSLKLNEGSDKLVKGSNLYSCWAIGSFDVKELEALVIKFP